MSGFFPIWDGLTVLRLVLILLSLVGWGMLGYALAPAIASWFRKSTSGYVEWMVEMFDRMFMEVPARRCVVAILGSMLAWLALALWLTSGLPKSGGYHVLRAVIAGLLVFGPAPMVFRKTTPRGTLGFLLFGIPNGYNTPRLVVNWLWNRRLDRFEQQMLDALTFMSNGLKSGLSLIQSMDMVREELPNPISEEFGLVLSEQRLGVPLEDALLNLERRIDTEDVQIMVTSINILRQSGGNLSETFDTIAHTIRERKKVEGRIKTLTAQGVAQGVIIFCMPFVLGFILYLMEPELISRLWTTALGWVMLGVMFFLQIFGGAMIKKIVTIDV